MAKSSPAHQSPISTSQIRLHFLIPNSCNNLLAPRLLTAYAAVQSAPLKRGGRLACAVLRLAQCIERAERMGAEMTGHWDCWVIWICEEDAVSPNRGLSISRLSRNSCTAMSQPKDIPVLGIIVWRYPRITMLDIHHCGGQGDGIQFFGDRI